MEYRFEKGDEKEAKEILKDITFIDDLKKIYTIKEILKENYNYAYIRFDTVEQKLTCGYGCQPLNVYYNILVKKDQIKRNVKMYKKEYEKNKKILEEIKELEK